MSKRRKRKKGTPIVSHPLPIEPPLGEDERRAGKIMLVFIALSALLFGARWYASRVIGFGDSEALYACYAIFPQPAYVDHPGLVGLFARALGGGSVPAPADAHRVTAILATIAPWLVALVSRRALGSTRASAMTAGLIFALVPEIAIGLFAMTPDLLLAYMELGAIGLAAAGMDEDPRSARGPAMLALAGLFAGVSAAAKISGVLVLVGLAASLARSRHRRSIAAWLGIAAGALVLFPVVRYEAGHGWPMLRHRSAGIGWSYKGVLAVTGGQLAYVSPILFAIAVVLAIDLWRNRARDDVARVVAAVTFVTFVPLLFVCLVHRGAEPHWLAPALVPLPLWAAKRASDADAPRVLSAKWLTPGAALSFAMVAVVHFWTLHPRAPSLAPVSYDPKLDITSELYGWPDVFRTLQEQGASEEGTAVVGPHWVICAQLKAGLPAASVGCTNDDPADFAAWNPPSSWQNEDRILFVSDERFPVKPERILTDYNLASVQHVTTLRGGRIIRTFTIALLERHARA